MKAAQLTAFKGPSGIEIVDVEKPKPAEGQVLVKVYASSVNPFDIKISEGLLPSLKLPMTLGGDIAGVVTDIGPGVDKFAIGNKVYGSAITLAGATGAYADFAAVPTRMVSRMPRNLDFKEAASVVLTGVSAVQGLLEHMKLKPNQKILIHGGAGGIGNVAIQIAKHLKAYVATTATGDGLEYVKKLGADQVIDYKNQNFEELLNGYDAVFDTVGGETYEKSFKVLRREGTMVSMLMPPDEDLMKQYQVTAIYQSTKVNTEHLDMLTKLIEGKVVKAHIDKVFSLEKIKEAFKEKQQGDVKGKIVIEIHPG